MSKPKTTTTTDPTPPPEPTDAINNVQGTSPPPAPPARLTIGEAVDRGTTIRCPRCRVTVAWVERGRNDEGPLLMLSHCTRCGSLPWPQGMIVERMEPPPQPRQTWNTYNRAFKTDD